MEWVGRIHKALEEERLRLYAQEIVPAAAQRRRGSARRAAASACWTRTASWSPPMAFIPAAERYNLMPAIDRWVIRTAFATLARHARRRRARQSTLARSTCPARRSATSACSTSCASSSRSFGIPHRHDLLRDHRDRGDRQPAQGGRTSSTSSRRSAAGSRSTISAAGMSSFALSQAPAGRLPQDRRQLREGHAGRPDRPRDGRGDQPYRPCHGQAAPSPSSWRTQRPLATLRDIGVDFAQGYGVAKPQAVLTVHSPAALAR